MVQNIMSQSGENKQTSRTRAMMMMSNELNKLVNEMCSRKAYAVGIGSDVVERIIVRGGSC